MDGCLNTRFLALYVVLAGRVQYCRQAGREVGVKVLGRPEGWSKVLSRRSSGARELSSAAA
jgi:hypothetical protein